MKKNILYTIAFLGITCSANAQQIGFDTQDYEKVAIYDSWETSPFRTGKLQGNCLVVDNPAKSENNASEKVLGMERSIEGSNQFGVRVDLLEKDRFELTTSTKYVHVLVYKPNTSRVMLVGLGKRTDRAGQSCEVEQFFVESSRGAKANEWYDAVFAIKGNGGIDIYSLVLMPDLASPHALDDDFLVYCDSFEVNNSASPRITSNEDYATSFDKSTPASRTDRQTTSITMKGAAEGDQTLSFSANPYVDITASEQVLSAKAGETVTPTFGFNGSWMSGYVYLDRGNDGKISYDIQSSGVPAEGSDLMAYSFYENKNSKGESVANGNVLNPPSYTIPADLANGYYRVRYKVDWNCIDPAGNADESNLIVANGGSVIDALIRIHSDEVTLNAEQLNGDVQTAEGVKLENTKAAYGQPFTIKMAPAPGFAYDGIKVRYGYNLSGDSLKHGNAQWRVITYSDALFDPDTNTFTIPAEIMKNDISIEGLFVDEKYKKKNIKVTYTVTNSIGDTLITETKVVQEGAALPAHDLASKAVCAADYFTLGETPAGVAGKTDTCINISYTENFPFEVTARHDEPKRYILMLSGEQYCLYNAATSMTLTAKKRASIDPTNNDIYHWYFMGDAFNGFCLYNMDAGIEKVLSASTTMTSATDGKVYPHMVATPVAEGMNERWFVEPGKTIQGQDGFFMGQVGYPTQRVNYRAPSLAFWVGGAGNGSTITIEEVTIPVGIDNPQLSTLNSQPSTLYNLAGQRVATLRKGVHIVNGKKVLY